VDSGSVSVSWMERDTGTLVIVVLSRDGSAAKMTSRAAVRRIAILMFDLG
jgi:hypothetical protein